jgi:hypothetical protein
VSDGDGAGTGLCSANQLCFRPRNGSRNR